MFVAVQVVLVVLSGDDSDKSRHKSSGRAQRTLQTCWRREKDCCGYEWWTEGDSVCCSVQLSFELGFVTARSVFKLVYWMLAAGFAGHSVPGSIFLTEHSWQWRLWSINCENYILLVSVIIARLHFKDLYFSTQSNHAVSMQLKYSGVHFQDIEKFAQVLNSVLKFVNSMFVQKDG